LSESANPHGYWVFWMKNILIFFDLPLDSVHASMVLYIQEVRGNFTSPGSTWGWGRKGETMRDLKELTTNELKNAIWDLNDGRCPGPIVPDTQAIRQELIRRGESPSGYHEEV
jgi:hypothetical protein